MKRLLHLLAQIFIISMTLTAGADGQVTVYSQLSIINGQVKVSCSTAATDGPGGGLTPTANGYCRNPGTDGTFPGGLNFPGIQSFKSLNPEEHPDFFFGEIIGKPLAYSHTRSPPTDAPGKIRSP